MQLSLITDEPTTECILGLSSLILIRGYLTKSLFDETHHYNQ